jgi:hypothetical protein
MSKTLDELAKQFEQWRSSPTRGRTTPPELLVGVARVLRTYNNSVVTKRLGINSALIKKAKALEASAEAVHRATVPTSSVAPSFIELIPSSNEAGPCPQVQSPLIAARMEMGSSTIHFELSVDQLMQLMARGHGGAYR